MPVLMNEPPGSDIQVQSPHSKVVVVPVPVVVVVVHVTDVGIAFREEQDVTALVIVLLGQKSG